MPVPTFVQAGAGVTIPSGTGTCSITGCIAGNVIIMQMVNDGSNATGIGRGPVVNIEKLDGTDLDMTAVETGLQIGNVFAAGMYIYIGRVMANGTCSQDFTVGTSGFDMFARAYEFSGVTTATTLAAVVENVGGVGGVYHTSADTGTDLRDEIVTTGGLQRLACNLLAINASQALTAFSGQTGGTWVEPVSEYIGTGTVVTMQLQTAGMPTAGTIDGGNQTIVSADWGNIGFGLVPAVTTTPGAGDDPPIGILGRGAGW